jgi:hypothetical protein
MNHVEEKKINKKKIIKLSGDTKKNDCCMMSIIIFFLIQLQVFNLSSSTAFEKHSSFVWWYTSEKAAKNWRSAHISLFVIII